MDSSFSKEWQKSYSPHFVQITRGHNFSFDEMYLNFELKLKMSTFDHVISKIQKGGYCFLANPFQGCRYEILTRFSSFLDLAYINQSHVQKQWTTHLNPFSCLTLFFTEFCCFGSIGWRDISHIWGRGHPIGGDSKSNFFTWGCSDAMNISISYEKCQIVFNETVLSNQPSV